jgi:hypothetical protein
MVEPFRKIYEFLGLAEYLPIHREGGTYPEINGVFTDFMTDNENVITSYIPSYTNVLFNNVTKIKFNSNDHITVDDLTATYNVFYLSMNEHAISLTIERLQADNSNIILCNSGLLTEKHGEPEDDDGNCSGIIIFNDIPLDRAIEIFNLLSNDVIFPVTNRNIDFFYFLLSSKILNIKNPDDLTIPDKFKNFYTHTLDELPDNFCKHIKVFCQTTGDCSFKAFLLPFLYGVIKDSNVPFTEAGNKINAILSVLGLISINWLLRNDHTMGNNVLDALRYKTVSYKNYLDSAINPNDPSHTWSQSYGNYSVLLEGIENLFIDRYINYNRLIKDYMSTENVNSNHDVNINPINVNEHNNNNIVCGNINRGTFFDAFKSRYDALFLDPPYELNLLCNIMKGSLEFYSHECNIYENYLVTKLLLTKICIYPFNYVRTNIEYLKNISSTMLINDRAELMNKIVGIMKFYMKVLNDTVDESHIYVYSFVVIIYYLGKDIFENIERYTTGVHQIEVPAKYITYKKVRNENGLHVATRSLRRFQFTRNNPNCCEVEYNENISDKCLVGYSLLNDINTIQSWLGNVHLWFHKSNDDEFITLLYSFNELYPIEDHNLLIGINYNNSEDGIVERPSIAEDNDSFLGKEMRFNYNKRIPFLAYLVLNRSLCLRGNKFNIGICHSFLETIFYCNYGYKYMDQNKVFIKKLDVFKSNICYEGNYDVMVQCYCNDDEILGKITMSDKMYCQVNYYNGGNIDKTKQENIKTINTFIEAIKENDYGFFDRYDILPFVVIGNRNRRENNPLNIIGDNLEKQLGRSVIEIIIENNMESFTKMIREINTKPMTKNTYNILAYFSHYVGKDIPFFEPEKIFTYDEILRIKSDKMKLIALCNIVVYGTTVQRIEIINKGYKILNTTIKISYEINKPFYEENYTYSNSKHIGNENPASCTDITVDDPRHPVNLVPSYKHNIYNNTCFIDDKITHELVGFIVAYEIALKEKIELNEHIFLESLKLNDGTQISIGRFNHITNNGIASVLLKTNSPTNGFIFVTKKPKHYENRAEFLGYIPYDDLTSNINGTIMIPVTIIRNRLHLSVPKFLFKKNFYYYEHYDWTMEMPTHDQIIYTGTSKNQPNENLKYNVRIEYDMNAQTYIMRKTDKEEYEASDEISNIFIDQIRTVVKNKKHTDLNELIVWINNRTNEIASIDIPNYDIHFTFNSTKIYFDGYEIIFNRTDNWIINKFVIDCGSIFLCVKDEKYFLLVLKQKKINRVVMATDMTDCIVRLGFNRDIKNNKKYTIIELNDTIKRPIGMDQKTVELLIKSYAEYCNYDNIIELMGNYQAYDFSNIHNTTKLSQNKVGKVILKFINPNIRCKFIKPNYSNTTTMTMASEAMSFVVDHQTYTKDFFAKILQHVRTIFNYRGRNYEFICTDMMKYYFNSIGTNTNVEIYKYDTFLEKVSPYFSDRVDDVNILDFLITIFARDDSPATTININIGDRSIVHNLLEVEPNSIDGSRNLASRHSIEAFNTHYDSTLDQEITYDNTTGMMVYTGRRVQREIFSFNFYRLLLSFAYYTNSYIMYSKADRTLNLYDKDSVDRPPLPYAYAEITESRKIYGTPSQGNFNISDLKISRDRYSIEMNNLIKEYYFGNVTKIEPSFSLFILINLCNHDIMLNGNPICNVVFSTVFAPFHAQQIDDTLATITDITSTMTPFEIFYQCVSGLIARKLNCEYITKMFNQINNIDSQTGGYLNVFLQPHDGIDRTKFNKHQVTSCSFSLIMGSGKSIMITPCLILRIIYYALHQPYNAGIDKAKNIYIVIPEHLVEQTYSQLLATIKQFFIINVLKIKETRSLGASNREFTASFASDELTIYIMSDTSMKCGLINSTQLVRRSINKSVYIFDEIDTILNPITSELNYTDPNQLKLEKFSHYYNVIFEILRSLFVGTEFNELKTKYSRNISNEPHFHVTTTNIKELNVIIVEIKNVCVKLLQKMKIPENIIISSMTGRYERINVHDEIETSIIYVLSQFFGTILSTIISLVNRRNYGTYDDPNEHYDNPIQYRDIILPFSYAETPTIGSQYSNPLLIMCLTIIEHLIRKKEMYSIVRKTRYCNFLRYMYLTISPQCRQSSAIARVFRNLSLRCTPEELSYETLGDEDTCKLINNVEIIKMLCEFICIKDIKYSVTQDSVYGLDLIMSFNTKYKIGYTGTPFAGFFCDIDKTCGDLDEYKDTNNLRNEDDNKVKIPPNIKKMYINKITKVDFNRIHYAVTKNCKMDLTSMNPNEQLHNFIQRIISRHTDHKVIIDASGTFINITYKDIYQILKNIHNEHDFKMIYWNKSHKPMYIDHNEIEHEIFNTQSLKGRTDYYYYFDHQHTTGIDVPIPSETKGLIFVDATIRFRDLAQSLFRMRKIDLEDDKKKQTGTFVGTMITDSNNNNITTSDKFFDHAISNEIRFINIARRNLLQQNIRSLSRYTGTDFDTMYKIYNFFNIPKITQNSLIPRVNFRSSCRELYKLIVTCHTNLLHIQDYIKVHDITLTPDNKIIMKQLENELSKKDPVVNTTAIQIQLSINETMTLNINEERQSNRQNQLHIYCTPPDPNLRLEAISDYVDLEFYNFVNVFDDKQLVYVLKGYEPTINNYSVIYYENKLFIVKNNINVKLLDSIRFVLASHPDRDEEEIINKMILIEDGGSVSYKGTSVTDSEYLFAIHFFIYFNRWYYDVAYFPTRYYTFLIMNMNTVYRDILYTILCKFGSNISSQLARDLHGIDYGKLRNCIVNFNKEPNNTEDVAKIIIKKYVPTISKQGTYVRILDILSCSFTTKIERERTIIH